MAEIRVTRPDGTPLSPEEERRFLRDSSLWWLRYSSGPGKLSDLREITPEEARARIDAMNLWWADLAHAVPGLEEERDESSNPG